MPEQSLAPVYDAPHACFTYLAALVRLRRRPEEQTQQSLAPLVVDTEINGLGGVAGGSGSMGYKRVPVDLNDLEVALTDRDGNSCFLDTDTGEIVVIAMWMESEEREAIADRLEAAPHGRYLRIDPIEPGVDYRDMVAFADTVQDQALRRLLAVALDGRGAFRRFKAVLADFPAEREGWFQFVNSRSKARVLAWLGDNGLSPAGEE